MIDSLNTALLELQSALTARSLYPASHPRIRTAEARAYQLLREIITSHGDVSLLGIDNRVIFQTRALPYWIKAVQSSHSLITRLVVTD